jgi:integrase
VVFSVKSPDYKSCFYDPFNKRIVEINSKGFETLYFDNGKYIQPANQWLDYLVNVKKVKDVSTAVRGMKRYWHFLENNSYSWNEFPKQKSIKPTYLYRNLDLLRAVKSNEIKASTASLYINQVVQFYAWCTHQRLFIVNEDNAPFESEIVQVPYWARSNFSNKSYAVKTTDLKIRSPRLSEEQSLNPLTKEEIKLYFQVLSDSNETFIIHQLLQIQCGLRIEEACTFPAELVLKPRFSDKRIEVEIGPHKGVHTKYGAIRKIEIPYSLMMRMFKYLVSENRYKLLDKSKLDIDIGEPLLINGRGKEYSSSNVQKYFGNLRKKVRRVFSVPFHHRTHDLRATYGTYRLASLIENGINPTDAMRLIMGWLGHKSEQTTFRYLRYLDKRELHQDALFMLDLMVEEALGEQ